MAVAEIIANIIKPGGESWKSPRLLKYLVKLTQQTHSFLTSFCWNLFPFLACNYHDVYTLEKNPRMKPGINPFHSCVPVEFSTSAANAFAARAW